ncbi:MAG TPA: CARDB domain-containing protein [Gemmatimonadota bacterium]|nr:CARDB domain-containing protein [Gemmatimonadota bacterium]
MKRTAVVSLLVAALVTPAVAQAQDQLSAGVNPIADKIECPLEELEWGIAQSFPDPWYSNPKVEAEFWNPGYYTDSPGPYTSTWMGKEMMSCRWKHYGHDSSSPYAQNTSDQDLYHPRLYVQRPWADIPEENYPCPSTVQVKVLSSLPSPWLGTTYQWSLVEKETGTANYGEINTYNYCVYGGAIPNEILRPVKTDYPEFGANPPPPPPSIDDFKQVFAVSKAELIAIPAKKTMTCPTTVRFEGRIHVNASGEVRYRVEENGQVGPLKTINADAAGGYALAWQSEVGTPQQPAAIGGLVTAPEPGNVATGRARLLIVSPSDGVSESNEASYEITCNPLAPVGGMAQTPVEPESGPLPKAAPQPQQKITAPQPKPIVEGGQNERIHKLPTRRATPAPANNALEAVVLLPDLRIRTASVDPSKPKEVKVRVANTGQAPSAATRVRVWVLPQGKAWYGIVPPLAAGQDAWTTVQADMPVMAAQKAYARADDPDKVKESDEGNNGHELK